MPHHFAEVEHSAFSLANVVPGIRFSPHGAIEANSGETLAQLALDGVRIARVGDFSIKAAVAEGRLVPLLSAFNPGDVEVFHAVFVGGANMPARVRVFIDYLVDCFATPV